MRLPLRVTAVVVFLLGLGVVLQSTWGIRHLVSSEVKLEFVQPTLGDVRDVITGKGTVGYRHQVSIRAGVAGRLERAPIHEGSNLKRDQWLFRIVDPQATTDQRSQTATQERHSLQIEHLQRDVASLTRLVDAGFAPRQELDARRVELDLALKDQELAKLDRIRLDTIQERALVRSPFDGVLISLIAAEGQWVNVGDELALIAGGSSQQIVAQVEAAEVSRLAVGQPVDFSDQPESGQSRRGRIVTIGEVAQGGQQAGTVRVTVMPESDFGSLLIGQSLYLEFVVHEAKTCCGYRVDTSVI